MLLNGNTHTFHALAANGSMTPAQVK